MTPRAFAARLDEAIERSCSLLCLGLDPADARDAPEAERFCLDALDAALPEVCAVKPNLAFFERLGSRGLALLESLRERVPRDRLLILDGKRGDIGTSAEGYASALYDRWGADAVTVNPLMGWDAVRPFLGRQGRGAFLLTRTSNPGAEDLLTLPLQGGERVYERIVRLGLGWQGEGDVGFVVGATDTAAVGAVRRLAPEAPLLIPGVGAQGGELEKVVAAGLDASCGRILVAISRGITASPDGATAAAQSYRRRIEEERARQRHSPGAL